MSEAARWVSLEQALCQAAVTECPWPSGMSIYRAAPTQLLRVQWGSLWWVASNPTLQTCFCSEGLWAQEQGVRVTPKAGPWGEVAVGEIPSPTQTRSKHRLDFQNPNLSSEIHEGRLLVGFKSRKRNEPQRAMGMQGGAQRKPLLTSMPSQTPRKPLILIQLIRHPQTSCLGASRLKVPSLQGAGAQA